MTTGVLIFAINNEKIDYVSMAAWSAKNIRRHLNLPVCLVTNRPPDIDYKFEQVVIIPTEPSGQSLRRFHDIGTDTVVTWYNRGRVDAYNLSPWNQTLVLDADYVVASDQLKTLLAVDQDFIAHKTAYDVTGAANFDELNNFGRNRMPMWWATVMMFRRSPHAELIFNSMTMIRDNWSHYRNLFGISNSTYRNDYALSIALGMVNGHTLDHADIPWKLASVTHDHQLTQIAPDEYRVDFLTHDRKPRWVKLNHDFHAMGKRYLGDIVANNS